MKKPKVFFLAANTGRSQIYAQAMLEFGLLPERTLIFGQNPKKTLKWENTENSSLNLEGFSPNMDEQIFFGQATKLYLLKSWLLKVLSVFSFDTF